MGHDIVTAARTLLGTRFRLHGRDPASGLDCIGLVLLAHARAGVRLYTVGLSDDYSLRGTSRAVLEAGLVKAGLAQRTGPPHPGDIALVNCGQAQFHLAILCHESHIHAHAGLRHVVETPGWPDGMVGVWCAV